MNYNNNNINIQTQTEREKKKMIKSLTAVLYIQQIIIGNHYKHNTSLCWHANSFLWRIMDSLWKRALLGPKENKKGERLGNRYRDIERANQQ